VASNLDLSAKKMLGNLSTS